MKINKLKIYALEFVLIAVLFFALFASKIVTRLVLAIFMLMYLVVMHFLLGKKGNKSVFEKPVIILMLIFSGLYLGVFYLLGLYYGFIKPKYLFNITNVVNVIIPLIIIIVSTEIIRKILLSQDAVIHFKKRKFNLSIVLVYIATTLVDLTIYTGIYDLSNLDDFLMAVGFVLFASLSCNLLYNYMSIRFGYKPIIIFRLITTLYMYILPVVPDVYIFLRSFLRMLYPFIIYLVLENSYAKSSFATAYKDRRQNIFWTSGLLIMVTLFIMLISCQFRYGIIVIGSNSMTGTINKGDGVVFRKYEGQRLEKGQVIIFNYNDIKTVHRIVDIRVVNGEARYVTRGDANQNVDTGYRLNSDIQGLVDLRIKYIGLPTLWLRSLFK